MLIVENLTGATSHIKRFECSASKLVLRAFVASKADFERVFVTLVVVDKDGQQKVITPRTSLRDLLEIAASNEGLVQIKAVYSGSTFTGYEYFGTIELSNFGAIDLGGGYGQIQLDNCVETSRFSFWGLDSANLTTMIIKYEPLWSAENQYKQVDISESYAVALPKTNLVDLELQFSNGRTLIYKPAELDAICQEINELAEIEQNKDNSGLSAVIVGENKLYCIGVKNCISMRVQYTASVTFYKVGDAILQ